MGDLAQALLEEHGDEPLSPEHYEQFKAAVQQHALNEGNWAGVPVLVNDIPLTLEPRYPYGQLNGLMFHEGEIVKQDDRRSAIVTLAEMIEDMAKESEITLAAAAGSDNEEVQELREDIEQRTGRMRKMIDKLMHDYVEKRDTVVNEWYSYQRNVDVTVYRTAAGRAKVLVQLACPRQAASQRVNITMKTMGVATEAWKLEVELKAQEKLKELLKPHLYAAYIMTGSFIETSPRSGLTYLFRRARPTIAMGVCPKTKTMRPISVLCLHPIGYYTGSWCGAMVPTDDVIAHLVLMRGDEHRFWKKANHHTLWEAEAGV